MQTRSDGDHAYREAKRIFLAALEISSSSDREAFLREQCQSDPALLDRVRALLDAHRNPNRLLDSSASAADRFPDDAQEVEATPLVANYQIIRRIGEGGMGLVYEATQKAPVPRQVAIKILKPGLDSREILSRFRIEQQALALMEHNNIAKVFDAGKTQAGYPFFAMELVKGLPITEYCDQKRLHPRERLKLFLDVCSAVSHAHQKGIIHRDLKPTNILVAEQDNHPIPKVIDFGLARAISNTFSNDTRITSEQRIIGTPRYMSPEQSHSGGAQVDTRSDVYSLGTILCELLTGLPPHTFNLFRTRPPGSGSGWTDGQSLTKPSSLLTTVNHQRAHEISEQRNCSQSQLSSILRGDLDWILMKALEHEPRRRYESVASFADDIRRFLNHAAIHARPPSLIYRAGKLARRHRSSLAIAAIAVSSLAFFVFSLWRQSVESRQNEQRTSSLLQQVRQQSGELQAALYAADVRIAADSFEEGDFAQGIALLRRQLPVPDQANTADHRGIEWFHLFEQALASRTVVAQFDEPLHALDFNAADRQIAVAGAAATFWSLENQSTTLQGSPFTTEQELTAIAYSPDRTRIAVGEKDGRIRVLDQRGTLIAERRSSFTALHEVCFSTTGNELVVSGDRPEIQIFDLQSDSSPRSIVNHDRGIESIAFSPDGQLLATASDDKQVAIIDWKTGDLAQKFKPTAYRATGVAFTPDGKHLVTVDVKGEVQMRSITAKKTVMRTRVPSAIDCLAISPDGSEVAVGCRSGIIHLIPLEASQKNNEEKDEPNAAPSNRSLFAHEGRVTDLAWISESRLASVSRDGSLVISNTKRFSDRVLAPTLRSSVVTLSDDGQWVASHDFQTVRLINAQTGQVRPLPAFQTKTNFSGMVFSPDGKQLLVGSADKTLQIANLESPDEVRMQDLAFPADYAALRFSANAQRLLLVSRDADKLLVVDYPGFRLRLETDCPDSYTADLSPDGRFLAMSYQGDVLIHDVDTGTLKLESRQHHLETINDLRFGPTGQWLATSSDDRTIKIWHLWKQPRPQLVSVFPNGVPRTLSIDSSGRTLIASGRSGGIWAFHLATRQRLCQLTPVNQGFLENDLSSDDNTLIALDNELQLHLIWQNAARSQADWQK